MSKHKAIAYPEITLESIHRTIIQIKEILEDEQRKTIGEQSVTWDELVKLGVIKQGDIPHER